MQALRVEQDGDLLRVTLARPERRNAFDAELIAELTEAFEAVGDDVRAVLLAGEGESFSAGADVDWMRSSIELSYEENVADARRLRKMLETIDSCPAPVVARVHGHALGGGCGLVACSDIVVAAPDTLFAFSEVKLGIIPAVISPYALAKIGAERGAPLLRHGRALRRRDGAADRPRARGGGRPRRRGRRDRGRAAHAPGPRPRATPRSSCSNGRTASAPSGASPSGGRARRARKASAPSSRSAARAGLTDGLLPFLTEWFPLCKPD